MPSFVIFLVSCAFLSTLMCSFVILSICSDIYSLTSSDIDSYNFIDLVMLHKAQLKLKSAPVMKPVFTKPLEGV